MGEWTVEWQILGGSGPWRGFKTNYNPEHDMYFVVEEIAAHHFRADNGENPWPIILFVKFEGKVKKYSVTMRWEPSFYVEESQRREA